MLNLRRYLWLVICIVSIKQNSTYASEKFSKKFPWCEYSFWRKSKAPSPELQALAEITKTDPLYRSAGTVSSNSWESYFEHRKRVFALIQKIFDSPLVQDSDPELRAVYISWGLGTLIHYCRIPGSAEAENEAAVTKALADFFKHTVFSRDDYSASDLKRIQLVHHQSLVNYSNSAQSQPNLAAIEQGFIESLGKTAGKFKLGDSFENQIDEALTKNGVLKQEGFLRAISTRAAEELKTLGEKKAQAKKMSEWISALERVNRLYWRQILDCFKIFRSYSVQAGFSDSEFGPVRNSMRKLAADWPDSIRVSVETEIAVSLVVKQLPE